MAFGFKLTDCDDCRRRRLDAPDLLVEPSPAIAAPAGPVLQPRRKPASGSIHKQSKPVLASQPSAALRNQLIAEINGFKGRDDLALWAHRRLPAKNTLTTEDAGAVEIAYLAVLEALPQDAPEPFSDPGSDLREQYPKNGTTVAAVSGSPEVSDRRPLLVVPLYKTVRQRNKAHLKFCCSSAVPRLSALSM
jgi:hypothetical protein